MFNDIDSLLEQIDQFKRNITSSENLIDTLKQVSIHFQQSAETVGSLVDALKMETINRKTAFDELLQYIEHSQTNIFEQNLSLIEKTMTTSLEEQRKHLIVVDQFVRQEAAHTAEQNEKQLGLLEIMAKEEHIKQFQVEVQELNSQLDTTVQALGGQLDTSLKGITKKLEETNAECHAQITRLHDFLRAQQHEINNMHQVLVEAHKNTSGEIKAFQNDVTQRFEVSVQKVQEAHDILTKQTEELKSEIQLLEEALLAKFAELNTAIEHGQKKVMIHLTDVIDRQNKKLETLDKKFERKTMLLTVLVAVTLITVIISMFV